MVFNTRTSGWERPSICRPTTSATLSTSMRVMSTNPSYLRTSVDREVRNFRDWGIPLGRRFRALKLWFLLREQGASGLRARLRRDLENAAWLTQQVDAAAGWERMAPVPFQTVCVRHVPAGLGAAEVDAHNRGWAQRVNESGQAYLTPRACSRASRWCVSRSAPRPRSAPTSRRALAADAARGGSLALTCPGPSSAGA